MTHLRCRSGVDAAVKLAEALSMPACTTYLHNDAFPASHELACGPLGYQGSQVGWLVVGLSMGR